MRSLWSELRIGLSETRRYLWSHHQPGEWDRCHALDVPGVRTPVRICARCTGVYPAILLALLLVGGDTLQVSPILLAVLPFPALLDWGRSVFSGRSGSNVVRTLSGFSLGFGYGMGLGGLLDGESSVLIVSIGLAYGLLALAGLVLERRRS